MSKAVVYTGAEPTPPPPGGLDPVGEWQDDKEVRHVTVNDGLMEIKDRAFYGCTGLADTFVLRLLGPVGYWHMAHIIGHW